MSSFFEWGFVLEIDFVHLSFLVEPPTEWCQCFWHEENKSYVIFSVCSLLEEICADCKNNITSSWQATHMMMIICKNISSSLTFAIIFTPSYIGSIPLQIKKNIQTSHNQVSSNPSLSSILNPHESLSLKNIFEAPMLHQLSPSYLRISIGNVFRNISSLQIVVQSA